MANRTCQICTKELNLDDIEITEMYSISNLCYRCALVYMILDDKEW